jgi:hypothetical protein
MTTDAAREAVFSTVELLEQILLFLPMERVFVIQSVSKRFRDAVAASVQQQEKLFLRPGKLEKTWRLISPAEKKWPGLWRDLENHRLVRPNEDLACPEFDRRLLAYQGQDAAASKSAPDVKIRLFAPAKLNPFLRFTEFKNGTPETTPVDTRKPLLAGINGDFVAIELPQPSPALEMKAAGAACI